MSRRRSFTSLLTLTAGIQIGTAAAKMLPNGSFEAGESAPAGWRLHASGERATGEAHTGKRSPSFRTSEPWLVHSMWYLLAVSALDGAARK